MIYDFSKNYSIYNTEIYRSYTFKITSESNTLILPCIKVKKWTNLYIDVGRR